MASGGPDFTVRKSVTDPENRRAFSANTAKKCCEVFQSRRHERASELSEGNPRCLIGLFPYF